MQPKDGNTGLRSPRSWAAATFTRKLFYGWEQMIAAQAKILV
jgi:hypothetical protein